MIYVGVYFGISIVISVVLFVLMVRYDVSIIGELFSDEDASESKLLESLFIGFIWPLGVLWGIGAIIIMLLVWIISIFEYLDAKLGKFERKLFKGE